MFYNLFGLKGFSKPKKEKRKLIMVGEKGKMEKKEKEKKKKGFRGVGDSKSSGNHGHTKFIWILTIFTSHHHSSPYLHYFIPILLLQIQFISIFSPPNPIFSFNNMNYIVSSI